MLCPRCGSNQSDDLKFCKTCGANLEAVRTALENPDAIKRFDWNDTWLAEMFRSGQAAETADFCRTRSGAFKLC